MPVLLPAHEVIFAENARTETLLVGPQVFAVMEPVQAALKRDPLLNLPARPIVAPGKVAAMILRPRAGRTPAQAAHPACG